MSCVKPSKPMLRLLSLFLLLVFWARTPVQCQSEILSVIADTTFTGAKSILLDERYDYNVHSANSATISYWGKYLILDKEHAFQRNYTMYYDDDIRVTSFKVNTRNPLTGAEFKSRKSDFTDRRAISEGTFHQDGMLRTVEAPCEGYPCIVELETVKKIKDFGMMGFPSWYPQGREQGVVKATYTARVPLDNELLYDLNQLPEPEITTEDGQKVYRWSVGMLPPQRSEPYAPPTSRTLPYLRVVLRDFEIENERGSFADWASFGGFIGQISEGHDVLPDPLRAAVHELTDDINDPHEKIDRLYKFMQTRMRYVSIQLGLGGWRPFPATYVEENRFGDCKALSNYMAAMLKEAGIPSYLVLILRGEEESYRVRENFATSAFNHMVLYLPDQDMYLECTAKDYPTGYMDEDVRGRNVIWITPEGGKMARVPPAVPSQHGYVRSVRLDVHENKSVNFNTRGTYVGGAQEILRAVAAEWSDRSDQLEWLHMRDYLPDVSGTKFEYEVSDEKPEVSIEYATTLYNHVRGLGRRIFVPINPHPQDWVPEANDDRHLPVQTATARMYVDTIRVIIPDNMEVESGGGGELTLDHQAGEYSLKVTPTDDGIEWVRVYKVKPTTIEPEDYEAYRDFFLSVAKAERGQLVVKEKRTK